MIKIAYIIRGQVTVPRITLSLRMTQTSTDHFPYSVVLLLSADNQHTDHFPYSVVLVLFGDIAVCLILKE